MLRLAKNASIGERLWTRIVDSRVALAFILHCSKKGFVTLGGSESNGYIDSLRKILDIDNRCPLVALLELVEALGQHILAEATVLNFLCQEIHSQFTSR